MNYKYDPELVQAMDNFDTSMLDLGDVENTRKVLSALTQDMNAGLDSENLSIETRLIPGPPGASDIPIRIYAGEGQSTEVPGLLHIHGGGFAIGDLDSELGTCIALVRQLGVIVVSVDYRLAPEVPYPGGLEDCYAALLWVTENSDSLGIDPGRIGLFGLSAGAGLCAATALLALDRNGPNICFQYLGIPQLDDRMQTHSMTQFIDTPMWHRPNTQLSWEFYLGESYERGSENVPIYASPSRAEDLSGLPPAYISTMEFDPLRDEGIEYAARLMRCGVPCELHSFPGTFHGSSMLAHAEVSQRELAEMVAVLRRGLNV